MSVRCELLVRVHRNGPHLRGRRRTGMRPLGPTPHATTERLRKHKRTRRSLDWPTEKVPLRQCTSIGSDRLYFGVHWSPVIGLRAATIAAEGDMKSL
eukprot:4019753-Pleurochrysis_carterae.AAC.1